MSDEELNNLEAPEMPEEGTQPADGVPQEAPQPEAEAPSSPASLLSEDHSADEDRAWYVIHCYSGYENKVRFNLEQRIESMGMRDRIFDVVIPTRKRSKCATANDAPSNGTFSPVMCW